MTLAHKVHRRLLSRTLDAWELLLSPLLDELSPAASTGPVGVAGVPNAFPGTDARLLLRVTEALARRYEGRAIELALGGAQFSAVFESLDLLRRERRYEARAELSDAQWDGLRFDRVSLVAQAVTLGPPPHMTLTLSDIEVETRVCLESLMAWLNRLPTAWQFAITGTGLIQAAPRGGGVGRFVLEPIVNDGELQIELRAFCWRRVTVRLPGWLRLTRQVRLPTLGAGTSLVHATCRGSGADLRLTVPVFSQRVRFGWLTAISGASDPRDV